jgi:hypothetical protein
VIHEPLRLVEAECHYARRHHQAVGADARQLESRATCRDARLAARPHAETHLVVDRRAPDADARGLQRARERLDAAHAGALARSVRA